MKLKSFFIVPVLGLAACASTPVFDYVKQGASNYQRTDAISECKYQVKLNKTPASEQKELIDLCMRGKGFRLRQVA